MIHSIRYGRVKAAESDLEWIDLPDHDFDGVGGFVHLLRKNGYSVKRIPEIRDPTVPHWPARITAGVRFALESRLRRMPWKSYQPRQTGKSKWTSWTVFSEEETSDLVAKARELRVSVNSLLLWSLDRASFPLLRHQRGTRMWLIPVNMRGGVRGPLDTAHQSAFIGLGLETSDTISSVHQKTRSEIDHNLHWAAWWSEGLGRMIGQTGIQAFQYGRNMLRHNWMGTFSNLGAWESPAQSAERIHESWVFAPPVTQRHPIGAGSVTWNGRLSIALNFHPALGLSRDEMNAFLSRWKSTDAKR